MKRYRFLKQEDIYDALNRLRNAFLAARNGIEVEKIINGLLTTDEKLKIGRRILIAECLKSNIGIDEISRMLKVGKNTIMHISRRLEKHEEWFDLIEKRNTVTEKEYQKKKNKTVGSSKLVFKPEVHSGFKRKDGKRV